VFVTVHPTVAGAFRTIADHLEQPVKRWRFVAVLRGSCGRPRLCGHQYAEGSVLRGIREVLANLSMLTGRVILTKVTGKEVL